MTDARHSPLAVTADELIARYDVLLLDAYGVLVHSEGALPGAAQFIARLNRERHAYFILTNDAAKLPQTAARRYGSFGLEIAPERMITSGQLLETHFAEYGLNGMRTAVLGTADSVRYVENAGGAVVRADEDFDVLVVADEAGYPFLDTVDAVLTTLYAKLDRGERIALVQPNPDLVYPKAAGGYGIASGSVALVFEAALRVRYPQRNDLRFVTLGKPHAGLFREAQRRAGTRNMVMIGDQLETDIRGANDFGIDSALVGSGVWLWTSSNAAGLPRPTYLLSSLA